MAEYKTYNRFDDGGVLLIDKENYISMKPTMTLVEYIMVWLSVFKKNAVRPSSFDRMLTSVSTLKNFAIASMVISDISYFDIQTYINLLVDAGYAMSTVKKLIQIVTAPLKHAAAMKVINADPTVCISPPKKENLKKEAKDVVAYTEKEQASLIKAIDKDVCPAYLCCQFMIETGLRVGEALALRWTDIDILHHKVKIHATVVNLANKKQSYVQNNAKSDSSNRVIPLTPKATELLNTLKRYSTTEWVFENHKTRLSYESLRYQTRKLCGEANVPFYGEHVFRHTFATNCYYRGVDVKVLSKLLGHSDVSTTYNTYINLYGDGFDTMYRALVPIE